MKTIIIKGPEATQDAYGRNVTNNPYINYNTEIMEIGRSIGDTVTEIFIGAIEFNIDQIPLNAEILSAQLVLHGNTGRSIGPDAVFTLSPILTAWDERTLSYGNFPAYNLNLSTDIRMYFEEGPVQDGYRMITTDISSLVRKWHKGELENHGVALNPVQTNEYSHREFVSSDSLSTDKHPFLRIVYNVAPSKPELLSPNGGETFNQSNEILWNPSTDVDSDTLQYQIQLSGDNGQTWKTLIALTSPGTSHVTYDFSKEAESPLARLRIRAYDGTVYGEWEETDGVFTIKNRYPPSLPTQLMPNGSSVNRTKVQRLSWKHNDNPSDYQTGFELSWRKQGDLVWNVLTDMNSMDQFVDISANTFPIGTIEWKVKTFDSEAFESPYSNTAVFVADNASDTPVILAPAVNITKAQEVIQWTAVSQISYQIVVEDLFGNVAFDTGEVFSTNKAVSLGTLLANGAQYRLKLRVKGTNNLWTDFSIKTVTVSYLAPVKPSVQLTPSNGHIVIDISNPIPEGMEPSVTHSDIYKKIDGQWVRIATQIQFQYRDYAVASGKEYEYKIVVWGDNGTFREIESFRSSVSFYGVWLHNVIEPEATISHFNLDGRGRSSNWEVESQIMSYAGRRSPVIQSGELFYDSVAFTLYILNAEDEESLSKLVKSRGIICYRDGRGRILFGTFTKYPLTDEFYGHSVNLELINIDYKEEV